MAASKPRGRRRTLQLLPKAAAAAPSADFRDHGSQEVLDAAAASVARELGRLAAREYFAQVLADSKKAS